MYRLRHHCGGTTDLFDVTCNQQHRTEGNPFLNGTKNGDVDSTWK